MVILGFMFNYMLRVNLTIAIVDMVIDANKTTNSTATPGPKFHWDKFQVNEALGSFFWGYILTELPGRAKQKTFLLNMYREAKDATNVNNEVSSRNIICFLGLIIFLHYLH